MAELNSRTATYREQPSGSAPAVRRPAALVGGSRPSPTNDLYLLLRRRLLAVIIIALCFYGIGLLASCVVLWRIWAGQDYTRQELIYFVKVGLTFAILGGSAWRLWRRPPTSLFGLRVIELLAIGSIVALNLSFEREAAFRDVPWQVDQLTDLQGARFALYCLEVTLAWFVIIVVYGAIIPNTFRRAVFVTVGMALCPLTRFYLNAFWLNPIPGELSFGFTIYFGIYIGIAIAIVAFSASRIEQYRRQAAEARQLGQYVLKEKLGAGGMGEVYRAEHVLLRRPCALKLIRPDRAGDSKNLRRFEREVQVTATLTHPNTVQIFDYGHTEDGTFYYVMEYLPGMTLEQVVKQYGPLPAERTVHLLRQLCGALREAHAAGLIHRDIKPSNVIVCERGGLHDVAKLLDFGIVEAPVAEPGEAITAPGQLLGTPAYMSVEQAAGSADLDARSDLYSLGATAYFMLTGKPPFDRPTINLTIAAQLRDPVTPPHYLRSEVPTDLSAVIVRCLEKETGQRFRDAADLDRALASCKCAGGWTDERAAQVAQDPPPGGEVQPDTRELERRWGI